MFQFDSTQANEYSGRPSQSKKVQANHVPSRSIRPNIRPAHVHICICIVSHIVYYTRVPQIGTRLCVFFPLHGPSIITSSSDLANLACSRIRIFKMRAIHLCFFCTVVRGPVFVSTWYDVLGGKNTKVLLAVNGWDAVSIRI